MKMAALCRARIKLAYGNALTITAGLVLKLLNDKRKMNMKYINRVGLSAIILCSLILLVAQPQIAYAQNSPPAVFYNIKQYGAIGDGKHLDSKAINKAI